MPKRFDVITFSDMCVDLIITGQDVMPKFGQVEKLVEDYFLELGGSCNIFACQAAKMGLRTAVVGRVGDDLFGQLIINRLKENGVDTCYVSVDPGLKTGLGIALCPPGDRAILTYMGSINALSPDDITDEIISSTRHIHHASHFLHNNLQPAIARIFKQAHEYGITTSLDTNWDPAENWEGELDNILPHTDIFFPNEKEALLISHQLSPEQAAIEFLRLGVKLIVIKMGEKGSCAFTSSEVFIRKVEPVVVGDSIGAGDSFDGGFIAGWLRSLPVEKCVEIGNFCGRSVASKIGGLIGQPNWYEIPTI